MLAAESTSRNIGDYLCLANTDRKQQFSRIKGFDCFDIIIIHPFGRLFTTKLALPAEATNSTSNMEPEMGSRTVT
jgi:hypothetical protein